MATSGKEIEEPVFLLAEECENLFNQAHPGFGASFPDHNPLFEDYQERFSAWAAYMGVFAKSSLCLDRRLRRHPDLQDLVIRYLDIVKINLSFVNDLIATDPDIHDRSGDRNSSPQTGELLMGPTSELEEALQAVDSAIECLNRMSVAIRRSSQTKSAFSDPNDMSAFNAFKEVSFLLVQYLYPEARVELQDHLSTAMAVRSDSIASRRIRQDQLSSRRARPGAGSFPSIGEDQPLLATTVHPDFNVNAGSSQMGALPRIEALRLRSEPTSVDRTRYRLLLNAPSAPDEGASSIVIGHVDYPNPPQVTGTHFTCKWCFESLDKKHSQGSLWRAHVDKDLKPYICLSEECAERMRSFPTPGEWQDHMRSDHGANWHRDVYPPFEWRCAFCPRGDGSFGGARLLEEHMEKHHAEIITGSQKEAIVSGSKVTAKRRPDFCPLCCKVVDQDTASARARAARAAQRQEPDPEALKRQHETSTPQSIAKRSRTDHQKATPPPDIVIPTSPARQPALNTNAARKGLMERHIKEHLQVLMGWTLRLLSIQKPDDDTESFSSEATESNGASSRDLGGTQDEADPATIIPGFEDMDVDREELVKVDDGYGITEQNLNSVWRRVPTAFHQPPEELSEEEEGELPLSPSLLDKKSEEEGPVGALGDAGVVLGSIPLVISMMEHYIDGARDIQKWRQHDLGRLIRNLQTERVKFQNVCEKLLEGLLPSSQIEEMVDNPMGELWLDNHTQSKVRLRLRRSWSVFADIVQDMRSEIEEFMAMINDTKAKEPLTDPTAIAKELKRTTFILNRSMIVLVAKIRDGVSNLESLVTTSIDLEPSRKVRSRIREFKILRDVSASIYRAVVASLGCDCTEHGIGIRLTARSGDITPNYNDEDIFGNFKFHLTLSFQQGQPEASSLWEQVEVEFLPSVAPTPSLPHAGPMASTSVPATDTPALDLCEGIRKAQKQEQVQSYGIVVDNLTAKAVRFNIRPYHMSQHEGISSGSCRMVCLRDILRQQANIPPLGFRAKLQLAVDAASSLLKLYDTPWLPGALTSENIFFAVRDQSPNYEYAFLMVGTDPGFNTTSPPPEPGIIRNPTLLALGILLIEISFGKTIEALRVPEEDLAAGDLLSNYVTARRLLSEIYQMGSNYGSAVRRCIDGEFERIQKLDLNDEGFQEEFYRGVVALLEEDLNSS